MKRKKWIMTLLATLVLLGAGGYLLWQTGFFTAATSLEGIQRYIEAFSPYSQLVFLAVQLASVVLAPIPSNITAAGGALLFGMWESFLLTWLVHAGLRPVQGLGAELRQPFCGGKGFQPISGYDSAEAGCFPGVGFSLSFLSR